MVSLEDVEQLAAKASEGNHAVVAVNDPRRGESLVLFTTDKQLDRSMLSALAKSTGVAKLRYQKIFVFSKKFLF